MNTNTQTYDKLVQVSTEGKIKAKKILAVIGYSIFFSMWLLFALNTPDALVPIIIAGALCTVILIIVSWKYFDVEYEYSIWYGSFDVAKIFSKKKRKELISADIKEMLLIAPATEEYIGRAHHFEPKDIIYATSSKNAEDVWLFVTGGEGKPHNLVFFEADERSLNMLRLGNPSVFVKKIY